MEKQTIGADTMPSRQPLAGEVLINSARAYTGVYPKIGEFGFDLYRMAPDGHGIGNLITNDGPHLSLTCITYPLLININSNDLKNGANFQFQGPMLGQLFMCYGYVAADMGTLTREVKNLELIISLVKGEYYFDFKGETGSILPETNHYHLDDNGPLKFSAWFQIPNGALATVVQNPKYAAALAAKSGA